MGDLVLPPEDVPPELIPVDGNPPLSQPQEFTPEEFFAGQLASGAITAEDLSAWRVLAVATQAYNAPSGLSQPGVEFLLVTVVLHEDADGARALFAFPKTVPGPRAIEQLEAAPGRIVLSYQELTEPIIGEDSRLIHFVSEDPNKGARFESFWLFMVRDRAVAILQVRDDEGALTVDDVASLASQLDARIREGLR